MEDQSDLPPPALLPEREETGEQPSAEPLPPRGPSVAGARPRRERGPRPDLLEPREAVTRAVGNVRLRLEPSDLVPLRDLPGNRGKTERQLGEEFFDAQASRLAAAVMEEIPPSTEIQVVVDPFSRQAFLLVERRVVGITSF